MGHHSAHSQSSSLVAFGHNERGVLGDGASLVKTPTPADHLPSTMAIRDISCGKAHMLIMDISGQVLAVGANGYGQLGLGDTQDRHKP